MAFPPPKSALPHTPSAPLLVPHQQATRGHSTAASRFPFLPEHAGGLPEAVPRRHQLCHSSSDAAAAAASDVFMLPHPMDTSHEEDDPQDGAGALFAAPLRAEQHAGRGGGGGGGDGWGVHRQHSGGGLAAVLGHESHEMVSPMAQCPQVIDGIWPLDGKSAVGSEGRCARAQGL